MLQIGIFVAVTAGSLTLLRLVSGGWSPAQSRFRKRLAEEFRAGTYDSAPSPLYKDLDALVLQSTAEPTAATPAARKAKGGWKSWADEALRQAGVNLPARQFLASVLGLAVGAGVLGGVFAGVFVGLAAAAACVVLPLWAVNMRRKARREKYLKQLVGAFELMARVLRAGQSVSEAFRAAVDAFDDPLNDEFGRCLHQIEHGLRPEAAFRELSDRSGILELRIFVVAMTIQRQTGGNLSEVLDRLAAVVRSRLRIRQKIRALTAEGRLQSLTLTVLPLLTFAVMYFLNRPYAESLLAQWKLLAAMAGCMTVGTLWIRSIMKFEG